MSTVRIADWLALARARGLARLDAQCLLGHVLGRPRAWLIAHEAETLQAHDLVVLSPLLERRAAGEPLAYLLGEREFHGLMLGVTPAVLVPRPETELLVDWAIECAAVWSRAHRAGDDRPALVDLGTGSGAIALALKAALPAWSVVATDASASALEVAARNAARLSPELEFCAGDWWAPLAGRRFALATANPPYIAAGDPHLGALRFEPATALTPGGDGLAALRRIAAGAPGGLHAGGWLLLEHGHDQGAAVRRLLAEHGFEGPRTRHDLTGLERCTGAVWPG